MLMKETSGRAGRQGEASAGMLLGAFKRILMFPPRSGKLLSAWLICELLTSDPLSSENRQEAKDRCGAKSLSGF